MKHIALMLGLLAAAPLPAWSGNLYKCAGADGKTVYQQTPCATPAAQLDHRSFTRDPEPVRRIGGTDYPTWEDTHPAGSAARPRVPAYDRSADPAQRRRAVGSECMINGVRVLHDGPCPRGASQIRALDRSQLCDEIRDARGDDSGEGASKRVYNRNKARDRHNC